MCAACLLLLTLVSLHCHALTRASRLADAQADAQQQKKKAKGKAASKGANDGVDRAALLYCERFLELTIDLLSQLPTRRFVATLLEDRALLVKCRLCTLAQHPAGNLFRQLSDLLQFYINFPINSHTGEVGGLV
jgi:hypothetical protein